MKGGTTMANDRFTPDSRAAGRPDPPTAPPSMPQESAPAPERTFREPQMRRWPHPVEVRREEAISPSLHYIHCALTYQNQTLADIKALVQQLVQAQEERTSGDQQRET